MKTMSCIFIDLLIIKHALVFCDKMSVREKYYFL